MELLGAGAQATTADQEWDAFLETQPQTGFTQSSWWANFLLARGWDHFGITVNDDQRIVGGARVLRFEFAPKCFYYYIPEGPILPPDATDAEEVFRYVMDFLEEKRRKEDGTVSHVRLEPRWKEVPSYAAAFRQASDWLEPRNTLCISLRPSQEEILGAMKPKGRYNVGLARRHGVLVVEDTSREAIEQFWDIYQETVNRHVLHGKNLDYFLALIPYLKSLNRGSLFFTEYQGEKLASVLVIYGGPRATYFFGGSRNIHRHVMAPYLLHFEVMLKAKALGCQWYDMYGVAPLSKPDDPWTNISIFKRKFGGEEFNFVRSLDYIYEDSAYEDYRKRRRERYQRERSM